MSLNTIKTSFSFKFTEFNSLRNCALFVLIYSDNKILNFLANPSTGTTPLFFDRYSYHALPLRVLKSFIA